MNGLQVSLTLLAIVAIAMAGGAVVHGAWQRRQARRHRQIPRHWPMRARPLVNSEERKVWQWLQGAFFDHHVMIKLPLTRFTLPRDAGDGMKWFKLLSGFYCTFTLCTPGGQVVGCVDVLGRNGITRSHRQVKETLLSQCGIAYWVVAPYSLPEAAEIRSEFLGEAFAHAAALQQDEDAVRTARHTLRTTIDRKRQNRAVDSGDLSVDPEADAQTRPAALRLVSSHSIETTSAFDEISTGWHQRDSFIAPLDSRNSRLH